MPMDNSPQENYFTYRNPGKLALAVAIFFIIGAVFRVACGVLNTLEIKLIKTPLPEDSLFINLIFDGSIFFLAYIIGAVFYCLWKVRCANNCRVFANREFSFTPNMTVACYFIPFANLWRPFQAMTEIWESSIQTESDKQSRSVLGLWWGLWVFTLVANGPFKAHTDDVLWVELGIALINMPLVFVILKIINRITKEQQARMA